MRLTTQGLNIMQVRWLSGLAAIARMLAGFILACLVAGVVTMLFVFRPADIAADPGYALTVAMLASTHSAIFAIAFTLIAGGIGEWLSIRDMSYYVIAGIVIGLLGLMAQYWSEVAGQPTILNSYALKNYVTTGFFGGLAYWLAAGQFAGRGAADIGDDVQPETAANQDPAKAGRAKAAAEKDLPRILVEQPQDRPKKKPLSERLEDAKPEAAAAAKEPAQAPPETAATSVPLTKRKPDPAPKPKSGNDSETA